MAVFIVKNKKMSCLRVASLALAGLLLISPINMALASDKQSNTPTEAQGSSAETVDCSSNLFANNVIQSNSYLFESQYVLVDVADNTGGETLNLEDLTCAASTIKEVNEALLSFPVSVEFAIISNYDEYNAPGALKIVGEAVILEEGVKSVSLLETE